MWTGDRREREFAKELDGHLQMHIDDNIRAGMNAAEARRDAILKLGGLESTRQAYRERGTAPFFETVGQDLRFASRQLRKNPGFTVTAVLMLTLGMAASVAIFAFVDAALLKPLPYSNPGRLVDITESTVTYPRSALSYPDYLDWKNETHALSSFAVYAGTSYLLHTPSGTEPVRGERVTDRFFSTLGVAPILGRDFYPGEDLPSAPRAVMLTFSAWKHRFAGRQDIVGQVVSLSGVPYTVVGVMPEEFQFAPGKGIEFWTAFHAEGACDLGRSCHGLAGIARLKDGVSMQAAFADVSAIAQRLEERYPHDNRGVGVLMQPLSEHIVGSVRPILLLLLSGAGLLLLIACVNVSSLLLVRSESRRREIAVRGALGASRTRLSRQFFTEGFLLVLVGSSLGVAVAYGTSQILLRLLSKEMLIEMPYLRGLGLNVHVACFALALALLATVFFSLTPMLRLSFGEMREGLLEGSRGSAGLLWRRLGSNLVVVELAIAVVLLVGAGLLGKSFRHLLHADLNFQPENLAAMTVVLSDNVYAKPDQIVTVQKKLLDRIATLPSVTSVSLTSVLPVSGNSNADWIRFAGRPFDGKHIEVTYRDVSANYFSTIGTRLLRGRFFREDEDSTKPLVVIVNQAFVKRFFPNEDPIGKRIGNEDLSPNSMKEIVGVIDDLREAQLDGQIMPGLYYPYGQNPDSDFMIIARTSAVAETVLPMLVNAIHQVDPGIGTVGETTMLQHINDSQTAYLHRSSAWLVGGFAALALLLGSVGLYGVVAYSVSQRTREIGIRMAMGAQRGGVLRLILREAVRLALWGIGCGIACALMATTLLRTMLIGVQPWDVATLGGVAGILGAAAMLASYLPARRAASTDPMVALRTE
jgi:macrolide transport system ATP-binding/permease protein